MKTSSAYRVAFSLARVRCYTERMIFSETDWNRLTELEPTYAYEGNLDDITLTAVVAPSQSGKSTLIGDAVLLAPSMGFTGPDNLLTEVDTITTRDRRPDDPKNYRTANEGVTPTWIMDSVHHGSLIQYSQFETGHVYATDRTGYPGRHNILPTQEKALRMLSRAGFARLSVVCIVRPADEWRACFPQKITTMNHLGRVQEAIKSLDFGMSHPEATRIVNYTDPAKRRHAAEALVRIAIGDSLFDSYHEKEYEHHNRAMYHAAQEMLANAEITA